MIIPPYLIPGARIGITCPAGAVAMEDMKYMFNQLSDWGFSYVLGSTIGSSYFKYSATDDERLADLQRMLDDDSIDAILFGRGGYGSVRIIDQLDFSKFIQKPKWLLGFSDITCIHSHIHTNYGIATIHAHMSGGYKPKEFNFESTKSILDVLTAKPIQYQIIPHGMNRLGDADGMLIGGNLTLLADLIGTPSDVDTKGKVLCIEDISEYKYKLDRMLWQMKRSGKLDHLAGLLVGGFTDTLDNEIPFGMTEYEMVWEKVKDYDYPVCFDFPIGHQPRNLALKLGIPYHLHVGKHWVELKEQVTA